MRELRGAGVVDVRHIAGTENPADMFTKVLPPQVFHKHRKVVMNLHGAEEVVAGEAAASRARRRTRGTGS